MSTSLGHTVPRYLVKHCSGWFCKHFLDEISVYTGRLRKARSTSPMWVGLARHSVPGLSRTKRQTLPWERESFSCLPALELGLRLFPAFRLGLKHWLFLGLFLFLPLLFFFFFFLGLEPAGLRTEMTPLALLGPQFDDSLFMLSDLEYTVTWANYL